MAAHSDERRNDDAGSPPTATSVVAGTSDGPLSGAVVAGETGLHLLADALRSLHRLPVDACPFDSSNDALVAEARRRVAAGIVEADAFDSAYRRYGPNELLAFVEQTELPPSRRVVIHGDARLDNLALDPPGPPRWAGLGRLGAGDPYRDLATLSLDLVAGGAASEVLGTFFEACGIDQPDVRRLDFHILLDQLLR